MKLPLNIAVAVTTLALSMSGAWAQSTNATPADQPAEAAASDEPIRGPALEPVTYDYVQQAGSMTFDGSKMTLTDLASSTIFFSDRPYRLVGHVATSRFMDLWKPGGSFTVDPPNAAISVLSVDDEAPAIVEIKGASLDGDTLTYDVAVLSGKLPDEAKDVALFIDRGGWHGGGVAWHGPAGGGGVAWHGGGWHGGGYGPHPYYPYYPPHPYYNNNWGAAAAGAAVGLAAGAAVGAAAASSAPTYVYPVPGGSIPANCHLNQYHSQMICSVPIN